jgi:GNAT superfamily N-acetyltransferase
MSFVIEPFSGKEMNETDVVLKAAYGTSYGRKESLRRYLELQPSYALVARQGGDIVGFGATKDYGRFAYIGLMASHPKVQRQGIGKTILDQILSWLSNRQCPTVLLDASPAGVHLYEIQGFVHEDTTLVFLRETSPQPPAYSSPSKGIDKLDDEEFARLVSFDEPFFGANRGSLLRSYFEDDPERFLVSRDREGRINGFLVAQARTLGPWVAGDSRIAEDLLVRALQFSFQDGPSVIVSARNRNCLELIGRYGFKVQTSRSHMYRGQKPAGRARSTTIYGQATLGFG